MLNTQPVSLKNENAKLKTINGETNKALVVSRRLNKIILESLDFEDVVQKISDSIPNELEFATGVVSIINNEKKTIKRVAASRTKEAIEAIKAIEKDMKVPFKEIEISLDDQNNLMAEAIRQHKGLITTDSYDVLGPVLSRDQSRTVQNIMGTKTTFVYPIYGSKDVPIGVFIASTNKSHSELSQYEIDMIQIFVDGVGIAIEHALLYSRLKDTSDKLATANERLEELDKLKDDFVSMASHELRTPMTAIKSYLWMALNKKKAELSTDLTRYLGRAYHSTERLISLVNDMLNISRIESGRIALRLEEVDPVVLAHEVVEEVIPKATELKLTVKVVEKKVSKILIDSDKIHEVIINLIGNSLKFTKPDGTITITFEEKSPFVYISVTDTGVGMVKGDMARLFKKFSMIEHSYTASTTSGGTGLGLYISKSIITLHKGDITAFSPGQGKGSTFTVSLPIAGTSTALELAKEAPKVSQDSKGLEKKKLTYI